MFQLSLHTGHAPDPATRRRAVPIYQTSGCVFEDTEDATRLFSLKLEVWTPRLNLDQDILRPGDFKPGTTWPQPNLNNPGHGIWNIYGVMEFSVKTVRQFIELAAECLLQSVSGIPGDQATV